MKAAALEPVEDVRQLDMLKRPAKMTKALPHHSRDQIPLAPPWAALCLVQETAQKL